MNLNPRRREDPEINLTPLIDVVFLMLIFFMVSTTFHREADLEITLPEASEEPARDQDEPIEITINAGGGFFVNDRELVNAQLGTVERALDEALADREAANTAVIIRADGRTEHQLVVTAMDAARQTGLKKVGIATVQPQE